MMYVGETPWHGLGKALREPATAAQAIAAASLDWDVVKTPLLAFDGHVTHAIPDRFAIVRKDWLGKPRPIFGVVGPEYTPLQNREAFGFFDAIVGKKAAIYHTAGALGEGERVWVLAKLPQLMRIVPGDDAEKYLLLSNSHDGSSAVQIKFTPVRVVCQNTLAMALGQGRSLRVPHRASLRSRMDDAAHLLASINHVYADIEMKFRDFAGRSIDGEQLARYLNRVFPDPEDRDNEDGLMRARRNRLRSTRLFEAGRGSDLAGVRGTLWAAYNGVTELVDHGPPDRASQATRGQLQFDIAHSPAERRLESVLFGEGYSIKVRAYRAACQMLN
jgi:phage/plasmid-like protein (TIGR03299 family)